MVVCLVLVRLQLYVTRNIAKIKPFTYLKKGDLACKEHAVIPVTVDDHLIYVERHNNTCSVYDFKIIDIIRKKAVLLLTNNKVVGTDYNGNIVIETAIRKSLDYHCRQPYYIKNCNNINN